MDAELNPAIQTPPPGELPPPSTEETVSLAEHAAQFDPKRPDPAPESDPVVAPTLAPGDRPRHRAKSQQASPADVPRIAELTKKLRDAERERDEWKAKHTPPSVPIQASPAAPAEKSPASAEKPVGKPTWDTFQNQIGETYQTWAEAQDAFADARDDWKDAQAQQVSAQRVGEQAYQQVLQSYSTKAQDYAKTTPTFFDTMAAAAPVLDSIPDLLFQAIVRHDNGPEIAYALVTHPDQLDEMCLLTDGKAVTESSVALLQRRLSHYRQPAAPIESAAPAIPRPPAPRPPNSIRTGPLKTGDDLPADGHSLAEHERAFGKKRR